MEPHHHQRAIEPGESLRQRFHAGDAAALDALVVTFYEDVQRFVTVVAGDTERGLDATQETFLRVHEHHAIYDPARAFRPWLFAIARRCALEVTRKHLRQTARVMDIDSLEPESGTLRDAAPTVAEMLLRQQLATQAIDALAKLDEGSRAIVHLHLFEELTFREVAEALDRPPSAVATTYYRALARLRELLESKESSHGA